MAENTTSAPATQAEAAPVEAGKTAESKATEAVVAKEIRKLKLKIDGKEEELPEEDVIRLAQLGKGAGKRFEEAAQIKKQAEQFINQLKSDPRSVLCNPALGIDAKKLAEEIVWERIQEESLTPEQRQAKALQRELEEYKKREKDAEAQRAQERQQALHEKYASDYDRRITAALQTANLPRTPSTVKRMAEYMFAGLQQGHEVSAEDVVPLVRKDYQEDLQALFGNTDEDTLLQIMGESIAKKIRTADLKRLKSTQGALVKDEGEKTSRPKTPAPKKLKGVDWRAELMRERLGK